MTVSEGTEKNLIDIFHVVTSFTVRGFVACTWESFHAYARLRRISVSCSALFSTAVPKDFRFCLSVCDSGELPSDGKVGLNSVLTASVREKQFYTFHDSIRACVLCLSAPIFHKSCWWLLELCIRRKIALQKAASSHSSELRDQYASTQP